MKIKFYLLLFVITLLSACQSVPSNNKGLKGKLSSKQINIEHRQAKNKSASDSYTRLGAGYVANQQYEKALQKLQKALELDNNNAKTYNYLGVLYWRLEQTELAENNFKRAHQLSEYDASISHNYAAFLCDLNHYSKSLPMFKRVFSNPLYDKLSIAYYDAGDCFLKQKKYLNAKKHFQKALKRDAKNSAAMLGMAKVFYYLKDIKLADYYYKRFVDSSRQNADSLWFGINIQRKIGDNNKLSSYILELKNLYPDSDETLMFIKGKQSY